MEEWPDLLPKPQRGYKIQPSDRGVLRSTSSTGRARERYIGDTRDDIFSIEYLFAPREFLIFEYLVKVRVPAANSSGWFTGPYHDGDGLKTGTLRIVRGDYDVDQVPNGNYYRVSCQLEVQSRQFDEYGVFEALVYPDSVDNMMANFENAWNNWYV